MIESLPRAGQPKKSKMKYMIANSKNISNYSYNLRE